MESAQDAQYAAKRDAAADLSPSPPNRRGSCARLAASWRGSREVRVTKQVLEALHDGAVVRLRVRLRLGGREHSQQVVAAQVRAQEEEEPCALQVGHRRDAPQHQARMSWRLRATNSGCPTGVPSTASPCCSMAWPARGTARDCRGAVAVLAGVRLGRMVGLQKPDGGVRGLVMSDVFRRVVARTLAQQHAGAFQAACAPFQYALRTRAGAESLARAVRAACEADGRTTVLSEDGVGAFDHISRASMLRGLRCDPRLAALLPFVAQFYAEPSTYLFYDEDGVAHDITQAEGGEQGDPLMPALYALGQHPARLPWRGSLCVP